MLAFSLKVDQEMFCSWGHWGVTALGRLGSVWLFADPNQIFLLKKKKKKAQTDQNAVS